MSTTVKVQSEPNFYREGIEKSDTAGKKKGSTSPNKIAPQLISEEKESDKNRKHHLFLQKQLSTDVHDRAPLLTNQTQCMVFMHL